MFRFLHCNLRPARSLLRMADICFGSGEAPRVAEQIIDLVK